jgi:hypothetical protein
VTEPCTACGRPVGNLAARCLYCGTAVAGKAQPAARERTVLVECPGCERKARLATMVLGRCTFCGLQFMTSTPGRLRVGIGDAALATTEEVNAALEACPPTGTWALVRSMLLARVHGDELGAGEAAAIVRALETVLRWEPGTDLAFLPITSADAEVIVPRAVFGIADSAVYREPAATVLLVHLASRPRRRELDRHDALNVLGLASLATTGVGFSVDEPEELRTQERVQLRVTVRPATAGITIAAANQIDQHPATPLRLDQERELFDRLASCPRLVRGYYLIAALYGPSCRGTTAFSITREAIAKRLAALGCSTEPAVIDALCIRMPPAFPPP